MISKSELAEYLSIQKISGQKNKKELDVMMCMMVIVLVELTRLKIFKNSLT